MKPKRGKGKGKGKVKSFCMFLISPYLMLFGFLIKKSLFYSRFFDLFFKGEWVVDRSENKLVPSLAKPSVRTVYLCSLLSSQSIVGIPDITWLSFFRSPGDLWSAGCMNDKVGCHA